MVTAGEGPSTVDGIDVVSVPGAYADYMTATGSSDRDRMLAFGRFAAAHRFSALAPDDRDRELRRHVDVQRVREPAVDVGGGDGGDGLDRARQRRQVEGEQAAPLDVDECLPHRRSDLVRRTVHGDAVDSERRGAAREAVGPGGGEEEHEADEQGTAGGSEAGELQAIARGRAYGRCGDARRARARA